jgi:hypothetical protein
MFSKAPSLSNGELAIFHEAAFFCQKNLTGSQTQSWFCQKFMMVDATGCWLLMVD